MLEICEDAKNEGRKVIIFSYFREVLERVKDCLQDSALDIIIGSISSEKRQNILDEFEASKSGTVLVSQIIAGGTGLNMQCAGVVILCNRKVLLLHKSLCAAMCAKQNIFDTFADESIAAKIEEEFNYAVKIFYKKKKED